jgi:hypothetical protein
MFLSSGEEGHLLFWFPWTRWCLLPCRKDTTGRYAIKIVNLWTKVKIEVTNCTTNLADKPSSRKSMPRNKPRNPIILSILLVAEVVRHWFLTWKKRGSISECLCEIAAGSIDIGLSLPTAILHAGTCQARLISGDFVGNRWWDILTKGVSKLAAGKKNWSSRIRCAVRALVLSSLKTCSIFVLISFFLHPPPLLPEHDVIPIDRLQLHPNRF